MRYIHSYWDKLPPRSETFSDYDVDLVTDILSDVTDEYLIKYIPCNNREDFKNFENGEGSRWSYEIQFDVLDKEGEYISKSSFGKESRPNDNRGNRLDKFREMWIDKYGICYEYMTITIYPEISGEIFGSKNDQSLAEEIQSGIYEVKKRLEAAGFQVSISRPGTFQFKIFVATELHKFFKKIHGS